MAFVYVIVNILEAMELLLNMSMRWFPQRVPQDSGND